MPTTRLSDDTPVVQFDPAVELSPFDLFRRLRDGRPPRLVDVRPVAGELTFAGAERAPAGAPLPPDDDLLLFDDDGSIAVPLARRLQAEGRAGARALFGGLELYAFALDPGVVGAETYLRRAP